MLSLLQTHVRQLLDPQFWRDNPFVLRDGRRDRARLGTLKTVAWLCATLFVIALPGYFLLQWIFLTRNARVYDPFDLRWSCGTDFGAALCALFSGIHIWFVVGASLRWTTTMLAQEERQNTIGQLLMLPHSRFQLLVQTMVYPWLAGMRVAVLLLPLYGLCVGLGGVSAVEVLMLYLVFSWAAITVPFWRRPMLGTEHPAPPSAAQGAAGTLPFRPAAGGTNQVMGIAALAVAFGCISLPLLLLLRFIRRANFGMSAYLPDSLLTLLPGSLFSWPLLIARLLITPLSWFVFHLPPLPFALLLVVLSRYTRTLRSAEFLSVGSYRDLGALPSVARREMLEKIQFCAACLVVAGYLWPWAVRDGGLTALLPLAVWHATVPGLPQLLFILVFWAAWTGQARANYLVWRLRKGQTPESFHHPNEGRAGAQYLAEPLAAALGIYLGCCLLGRVFPFPDGLAALTLRMLLVAAAGVLLQFGASSLIGRGRLHLDIFLILLVLLLPESMAGFRSRLFLLSPTLGLIYLVNPAWLSRFVSQSIGLPGSSGALLWWLFPAAQAVVGIGAGSLAALLHQARTRRARRHAPLGEYVSGIAVVDGRLQPVGAADRDKFPSEESPRQERVRPAGTAELGIETPLALHLIDRIQKVADNAVAVKELRVRLRGRLQHTALLIALCGALLLSMTAIFGLGGILEACFGEMAERLFHLPHSPEVRAAAQLACGLYLLASFAVYLPCVLALPRIYAPDRDRSTLGFLLTTPLSSRAIVSGKALGTLLPDGLIAVGLAAWTLALSLLLTPWLGPGVLLVWLKNVVLLAAIFLAVGLATVAVASLFAGSLNASSGSLLSAVGVMISPIVPIAFVVWQSWIGFSVPAVVGWIVWGMTVGLLLLVAAGSHALASSSIQHLRTRDIVFSCARHDS